MSRLVVVSNRVAPITEGEPAAAVSPSACWTL